MEISILFVIRQGEEVPEALEIADQYAMDVNPGWLNGKLEEARKSNDYVAARVIDFKINASAVMNLLHPPQAVPLEAAVIRPPTPDEVVLDLMDRNNPRYWKHLKPCEYCGQDFMPTHAKQVMGACCCPSRNGLI